MFKKQVNYVPCVVQNTTDTTIVMSLRRYVKENEGFLSGCLANIHAAATCDAGKIGISRLFVHLLVLRVSFVVRYYENNHFTKNRSTFWKTFFLAISLTSVMKKVSTENSFGDAFWVYVRKVISFTEFWYRMWSCYGLFTNDPSLFFLRYY